MVGTDCGTAPCYSHFQMRDIGLDAGDIKNGFLSFDSKLMDPFSHFLNINDVLIMHPVCYIFDETGLKADMTSIGQGLVTLQARCPLIE